MKPIEMAEEEFPIAEEEADEIAEGAEADGLASDVAEYQHWITLAREGKL